MKRFVIALMVAALAAIALAQTAGAGDLHRQGRRQLAAKLNLTDAQKQQMKDIRSTDREKNKQLYADFRAKRQELRTLRQANDPGASDVKAQLDAMRPQIHTARKASRQAMAGILTPDQRAQLRAERKSRRGAGLGERSALRGAAAQKLNITDAQKTQLKQLRESARQNNAQLFAGVRAKRQELRSLMRTDDPRASDVKAQLEALRPQLEAARQQQHSAFLSVLTPEQREQLEQWKAQRQSNRSSR